MNEKNSESIENPDNKHKGIFNNIAFGIRVYNILSIAIVLGVGTGLYWGGKIDKSIEKLTENTSRNEDDIRNLTASIGELTKNVEVISQMIKMTNKYNNIILTSLMNNDTKKNEHEHEKKNNN